MAFNKKNGKTMSGFFKIRDFFLKSVLRKTAEFSVSDTGDPFFLTCLNMVVSYLLLGIFLRFTVEKYTYLSPTL